MAEILLALLVLALGGCAAVGIAHLLVEGGWGSSEPRPEQSVRE